jgi:hypothetical protein
MCRLRCTNIRISLSHDLAAPRGHLYPYPYKTQVLGKATKAAKAAKAALD